MLTFRSGSIDYIFGSLSSILSREQPFDVGTWQAQHSDQKFLEIRNVIFEYDIPHTMLSLQAQTQCNLPWAEDHFKERISGNPLNPPPSAKYWPYAKNDHEDHVDMDAKFSHTYPERFWPRFANTPNVRHGRKGIRYDYGDLNSVVNLLRKDRHTRQAYLPVWFPEDTGAASGQRVPCTLGYHFIIREGMLNCTYMIRSCDLLRHFRDDVYMAGRLIQWLGSMSDATSGTLNMHIMNLHAFESDRWKLLKEADDMHRLYGMAEDGHLED